MQKFEPFLDRFSIMLTEAQQEKILSARLILFGVGGVGSALAEFLVRSGIQNLDIVDFDTIDLTNVNRQLVAFQNNVGKLKVNELKTKLKNINPKLNINTYPLKLDASTIYEFNFNNYDLIVDCIDDIKAKQLLILKANEHKKYILSAMGAGNRYKEIPVFEIADIKKTSYDPIAKILRKFCASGRINKLEVCYTKIKAQKFDCKTITSVVYYPVNMATVMCARIINKILEE